MNIHVVSCVTCIGMDSPPSTSLPTTLQASLDAEMKRLQGKGTGSSTKQAEVLTKEEEDLLWEKELLGGSTPQSIWSSTMGYTSHYEVGRNTASSVLILARQASLNSLGRGHV